MKNRAVGYYNNSLLLSNWLYVIIRWFNTSMFNFYCYILDVLYMMPTKYHSHISPSWHGYVGNTGRPCNKDESRSRTNPLHFYILFEILWFVSSIFMQPYAGAFLLCPPCMDNSTRYSCKSPSSLWKHGLGKSYFSLERFFS